MLIERVEQRVLAALQMIDSATRTPVTRRLTVQSERARLLRNRRGYYVVTRADGMLHYSAAFSEPPDPPADSFRFEIDDPQHRYLPRVVTLDLPRDPDPANAGNEGSLFTPRDVAMYPASTASLSHNWSTVRASVLDAAGAPVQGAWIHIVDPGDDAVLAAGYSDRRGEALVIVPGVPVTKFADGDDGGGGDPPVVVNSLPVRLELSVPASSSWPVDPDLLAANHAANRQVSIDLALSTGRMQKVAINLS